ncbi:MAG TPA: alpha/beta hydrolase [Longimicrobiales bacterium]|nr:alpha/beta hydrolase [Longimicrobiales bacterium]
MTGATFSHVTSADGTRLGVWQSGSGPALVAVHGTTADHTRWSRIAPLLEAQFSLHTMDRRGRGRSDDTAPYSIQREAEDVAAVVRLAGERVTLLGHSYGALCCLEAALQLPGLFRMIVYEPPLPIGAGIIGRATRTEIERLLNQDDREGALLCFFRDVVGVPDAELESLKDHPVWPARVAAAHTVLREADAEEAYELDLSRFGGLSVPTLLILGGDSPDYFREAVVRLDAVIPDSRVHVLPGQQHIAMDTAPEEFVEAVVSFASTRDRPPA